ncbi:hypothetical protein BMS3Abin07_00159 [bacterium BMS3Abin07]|nr:hypothetical protein BMS3Abin07_00159 [bacterium BMS3Abin07]GBE33488.1 hypothetical protein BMS3Bbin05_02429 [bacterium BMS3Bbin05]
MSPRNFIKEIIKLYFDARKPKFGHRRRIKRGESRSISSLVEDLFAKYLLGVVDNKYDILISPILSFDFKLADRKRNLIMKPDICLASSGKAYAFFDLKMDLGYKRKEFIDNCRRNDKIIQQIKGKQCKFNDGLDKSLPKNNLTISKRLKYHIVVISAENIKSDDFRKNTKNFKTLKSSSIYVLTTGLHPNTYGKEQNEILNEIKINMTDFKKLHRIC